MSLDWDGYEIYHPGVIGPLNMLPRAEARAAFTRRMQAKGGRIEMLRRLLKANGVELGSSDAAIQDLNDWFWVNVQADPQQPGRLLPEWYSVVHDVALFLGDVIIERHPNLRWEFYTWGKKNVSYQRHVIMGFETEDPKFKTNVDIDQDVAGYAHEIIVSRGSVPSYGRVTIRGVEIDIDAVVAEGGSREVETDAFYRWLQIVARRA
jgi:hypothetical protein